MKIAYIYDAVYPWVKGGAEKRIYEIGKRLADKGHEVHWYGIGWWFEGNNGRTIDHDGIILHGVCEPMQLYVDGRRSIKEAIYFAGKLLPKLVKERFDVIDCQEFPYFPCFTAKVHSLLRRTPIIITWYEIWGDYWFEYLGKKGIYGYLIEKITLKLPDLIIANSEKIKDDLTSVGVDANKIKVSPNGIDYQWISEISPKNEELDILYAGRLIEHKNVDVLIKAINIVKKEIPDIKCGVIGDGPERERLERLSKDLGLENNVKFFGFLEKSEDVLAYMKSSKVFVLPSTREGSPVTAVEANACGLPIITVDHPNNGTVSLIEERENGFICELNEESMAEKIVLLLADESLRSQMSKRSVEYAKRYDWRVITRDLEKIYGALR
ncbi:MAG: glycosyltransferase family 4 protein [Candidatus Methanospirare jalkutatii]|nr:glycosyltransferase family 4 protein [Candidatus Methanospirare jalkutatii]